MEGTFDSYPVDMPEANDFDAALRDAGSTEDLADYDQRLTEAYEWTLQTLC
jgi:hypothetical protein